jgi:hypothetical protein
MCGTEEHLSLSSMYVVKMKGLTALILEMDCDQMAMGLPPVTYAVLLIVNSF